MADANAASPVAICPVCLKPLADLPAVLRQGEEYVHATFWTGEEPVEKATADDETAEGKKARGQAALKAQEAPTTTSPPAPTPDSAPTRTDGPEVAPGAARVCGA